MLRSSPADRGFLAREKEICERPRFFELERASARLVCGELRLRFFELELASARIVCGELRPRSCESPSFSFSSEDNKPLSSSHNSCQSPAGAVAVAVARMEEPPSAARGIAVAVEVATASAGAVAVAVARMEGLRSRSTRGVEPGADIAHAKPGKLGNGSF